MVKISGFKATRPTKSHVSKFITKGYSYYSKKELISEQKNNPYSFLNILNNNKTNSNFNHVQENLQCFKKKEIIRQDKEDYIYIYDQIKNNVTYSGIICGISLKEYKQKKIKIHEKTLRKRELIFAKYLSQAKVYAEPVLITHKSKYIHKIINENKKDKNQLYNFIDIDNTQHIIWTTTTEIGKDIIKKFSHIDNLYIADGHHRMSSSLINDSINQCLAYIVPYSQLTTLPFHRIIHYNSTPKELLNKISKHINLKQVKTPFNSQNSAHMYLNKVWYKIQFNQDKTDLDLINNLFIKQLSEKLLKPVFKIKDERNNKDIKFIPGDQCIEELIKRIEQNQVLFYLPTIKINTIMEISDNNKTMPPKSTFIIPKIPSGLIMMEL
tara:strand:- start:1489 stop:2634 length:1146 start_codon:yes stop_codon:yes gene_type:complete